VARAIHSLGARSQFPLISVNCAAVSSTLAESELFGHKEGAFTGAVKKHRGLIEHADRGILFLDEIGDMPLELQAKLLRVLDSGELRRVGEAEPIKVNVRIISATNRELTKMVEEETFRKDLYYRISGFTIKTTPLRERREDIPLLTMFFIKELSQDLRKTISIQPDALQTLTEHNWSGNVRELKHCISLLAHTSPTGEINVDNVRETLGHPDKQIEYKRAITEGMRALSNTTYAEAKNQLLDNFETGYFTSLLASVNGNVSRAAEIADMHRKNFLDKLKRLNIDPNTYRV
jgi:DNA-binding NtrC family response regulator